ncbi:TIR domain-containing protein [Megasphaera elsdenii]|uniref:TIR domain-containing protein n=1 Tax=Megasphaera elsdenii TaxID=907 RepID=UPI004036DCAF
MGKTINIFVSHAGEDEHRIDSVKSLLQKKGFIIRDASIKESEPNNASSENYIKYGILRPHINWAGCMLVLIGPKTASKEWVNWEITYAMKQGKRIVGVFLQGAKDEDVPEALTNYGHALVGWNSNRIADAINGEDLWMDSTGVPKKESDVLRSTC